MSIRKPWNYAIDLKDICEFKKDCIIPLSMQEQKEIATFLNDQLIKEYIYPSKSPQTLPVFFIHEKKKHMI